MKLLERLLAIRAGHACSAVCLVVSLLVPARALAQDPEPQNPDPLAPASGRPPVTPKAPPQRLDFGLSLFEGYDVTLFTQGLPGVGFDRRLSQNASFSGGSATLTFSQPGDLKSFGAVGGSDFRYYSLSPELLPMNFFGGLNFSAALGKRVRVSAAENVSYSPFYSFGGFPFGDSLDLRVPQNDYNVAKLDTYTSYTAGTFSWLVSRRTYAYGNYNLSYVNTSNAAYRVLTQGATGGLAHRATRYLTIHGGYGYSRSQLESATTPYFGVHNIDAGVAYARPLSFSRRTNVAFSLGSALLTYERSRYFTVTGSATLTHQLSRTWAASANYTRNVSKVGGLADPYVNDALAGTIAGRASRNVLFTLSGGYIRGAAALGADNGYRALTGSSRMQYDLTRHIPVYVEYVYYRSQFDTFAGVARGIPQLVQRHGVRVGLGYTVPLVGRRAGER